MPCGEDPRGAARGPGADAGPAYPPASSGRGWGPFGRGGVGLMVKVRTPTGLQPAGRRLWLDVSKRYELRADELLLLEKACRTADDCARLDEAVAAAPLTVKGSMGQVREHPLLAQARQTRALLAALLKQLALPDEVEASGGGAGEGERPSSNTVRAMTAARARWGNNYGVRGGA